jgi:hypothetical protein
MFEEHSIAVLASHHETGFRDLWEDENSGRSGAESLGLTTLLI